ncbi:hypothetical protein [Amycolatopsis sp. H20-H5]|uniref:hypothetical protein n=1 Tax=Amycolatopsis sp. H20-H5 TaxID=3046309 RepID=UPI002DB8D924|nr:hypothetical protein [Amycolatopsis sp. H20-H5]MEC3981431.1 hypothetical protein [Amycolatopsis sp. H20-H5]
MSWQDELRRIDSELAAGRLGHTEHRKKRDELLAEASGGGMPSPVASPLRHPHPEDGTRPQGYPDARADAWRPAVPDAETTAWHSTNPATPPSARPTVPVRNPAPVMPSAPEAPPRPAPPKQKPKGFVTDRRTTAPSPADVNPTEFMNIDALPRFGRRPPLRPATAQQPLPALAPKPPSPPPLPPSTQPYPTASRSPKRPSKGKPTWLFLSVGVLLVLAMIIGGTWWLGSKTDTVAGGTPSAAGADGLSSSQSPTVQPTLEELLPKLPGTPSNDNSTMSVAKGAELNLYSTEAAGYFTGKGVKDVVFRGSSEGTDGYLILVIPTSDPQVAKAVAAYLHDNSVNGGLAEQRVGDRAALVGKNKNGQLCGAGYTSGGTVVTAWVSASLTADKQSLDDHFGQTMAALEKVLPPG